MRRFAILALFLGTAMSLPLPSSMAHADEQQHYVCTANAPSFKGLEINVDLVAGGLMMGNALDISILKNGQTVAQWVSISDSFHFLLMTPLRRTPDGGATLVGEASLNADADQLTGTFALSDDVEAKTLSLTSDKTYKLNCRQK